MKENIKFDYYSLYLNDYLEKSNNPKAEDADFIIERSNRAAEMYETKRKEGLDVLSAQEAAMSVLLEGFLS